MACISRASLTRSAMSFDSCCRFFRSSRSPRTRETSGEIAANASSSTACRCLVRSSPCCRRSLATLSRGDNTAPAIACARRLYASANCSTFLWFASSAALSAFSASSALSVSKTNFEIARATCPPITAPRLMKRPVVPPATNPSCVILLLTARNLNSRPPVEEKKSSMANASWLRAREALSAPPRPTSPNFAEAAACCVLT